MATDTTQAIFLHGIEYYRRNRLQEAANSFRAAFKDNPENPLYLSYYGLIVALQENCLQDGITFCRAAIQRAPYEADLYLNLSRIFQFARQRQKALETLVQGISSVPDNQNLKKEMKRMGMRRKPFFQGFSRDHLLNRFLGRITYRMKKSPLRTQH
jgi:tetratricopeptide (TPR) repeat protein